MNITEKLINNCFINNPFSSHTISGKILSAFKESLIEQATLIIEKKPLHIEEVMEEYTHYKAAFCLNELKLNDVAAYWEIKVDKIKFKEWVKENIDLYYVETLDATNEPIHEQVTVEIYLQENLYKAVLKWIYAQDLDTLEFIQH